MTHVSSNEISRLIRAENAASTERWAHVDGCAECRERYVSALFASAEHERPLDDFEKDELFEDVLKAVETKKVRLFRRPALMPSVAGLAAAAALVIAFIGNIQTPRQRSDVSSSTPKMTAPRVQIAGSNGVRLNGEMLASNTLLDRNRFDIATSAGDNAHISLADVFSLTLGEKSSMSVVFADKNTVSVRLLGSLDGELDHNAGYDLVIGVPGGSYRVIGTVFHISADSLQSRIRVLEGAVAYVPNKRGMAADTIRAGDQRSFVMEKVQQAQSSRTVSSSGAGPEKSLPEPVAYDTFVVDAEVDGSDESAVTGDEPLTLMQRAKRKIQQGRPDDAKSYLRAALATPERGDALLHLGFAFEKTEDYDSALAYYNQAAGIAVPRATRSVALANLGRLSFTLGRPNKASEAYRRYLQIAPNGAERDEAFRNLVNQAIRDNNYKEQIELLSRWVVQSPNLDTPMYLLATAYREKGDLRYAIRHYETYILKYPDGEWLEDCYYWAAMCYRELGQHSDYERKVKRYQKLFPRGQRLGSL